MVNTFLVHHIKYGKSPEKTSFRDNDDVAGFELDWSEKSMHENEDIAKKLIGIEDIFKSIDATG